MPITVAGQFAKRQMTWFRGMERRGIPIHWLPWDMPADEFVDTAARLCRRRGEAHMPYAETHRTRLRGCGTDGQREHDSRQYGAKNLLHRGVWVRRGIPIHWLPWDMPADEFVDTAAQLYEEGS